MRVYAMRTLVDGGRNYRPGDEITEGTLFEQADYYEAAGCVRIERRTPLASASPQHSPRTQGETKGDGDGLDGLTVAQLREIAQARGVSYSGLRKRELIEALRGSDKEQQA